MAVFENRRIPAAVLEADRNAVIALQALENYTPRSEAHSIASVRDLVLGLDYAQQEELLAIKALAAARSRTIAAGWALHNGMLGVKREVVAQFGADSIAIQAVGYKKKSDRRRPRRRKQRAAA